MYQNLTCLIVSIFYIIYPFMIMAVIYNICRSVIGKDNRKMLDDAIDKILDDMYEHAKGE